MPQVEAWEKVLVKAEYLTSTHGTLGCRTCHGGPAGENTFADAHVGVIIDPSSGESSACNDCHGDIVDTHAESLHGTLGGYFSAFLARSDATADSGAFQAMFSDRCAECHASCGQCHVSRPDSVLGGLVSGHDFRRTPSQTEQCVACHGSRVGDEFRGRNAGIDADAHYLAGFNCMDCHAGTELHGDGTTPQNRYANQAGPRCEDCHALDDPNQSGLAQQYHSVHGDQVQCQVCHSVQYKNCYQCHVEMDSQGVRFPSRLDFRIGLNPLKSDDRPYDYVVLRHVPIAPDTFEPWGLALDEYSALPTWRYATPHNIQKNTPQTASCGNCHGELTYFLSSEYIQSLIDEGVMVEEEIEANAPVVVDEPPASL